MILRSDYVALRQARAARQQLVRPDDFPVARFLPAPPIDQAVRVAGIQVRERVFTPAVTLWTFITQVLDQDHSCRQAVARLNAWRVSIGLAPCSADTAAYCQARLRFPEDVLHELVRQTGRRPAASLASEWLWKGRHVKVVDGTCLSMPDTPANQKEYPQQAELAPGVGFPLLRMVTIFSLADGTVLDAAMARYQGKKTGEVSLFRTIDSVVEQGDVLVADRLYGNFWEVARLQQRDVDVVMRMHAGRAAVRFRGRGHSKRNRKVWWKKPQRPQWMREEEYETYPQWIRLRAVRVDLRRRGLRTKQLTLVTTLTNPTETSFAELAELYRRRWQVELDLRSLKVTMQMDILRGKSPAMVRKEIWAHLLAYNLVRAVMAEAAAHEGVAPEKLSFAGALQTLNAFLPYLMTARTPEDRARLSAAMLTAVATHHVGDRPNRYEPRAVRRRPKKYRRLKEPRRLARSRMGRRT
jgi:hypothetical protein